MIVEREVLISVLNLTKNGKARIKDVIRDAKVSTQAACQILDRNMASGILRIAGSAVMATPEQRLRIAIKAVSLGADVERVCKHLRWEEFEEISAIALEANGFKVKKHFRFVWNRKRFEIDLVALKRPFVVCVDCKRWCQGWMGAASRKVAEKQIERTRILAEASAKLAKKIGIDGWDQACFVPVIVSLLPSISKFHKASPIVPIIQLRSFIQAMPAHLDEIDHYWVFLH
ncbi:MAG: restriction endonuclease [Candidatus Bathyarchaeota archaeon B63]|nr:MAG: restriction endonuclease [Candidatus Bathyarchaeota archaeon B63]